MKNLLLINHERRQIRGQGGSTSSGVLSAFSNELCINILNADNLLIASNAEGTTWSATLLIEGRKVRLCLSAYPAYEKYPTITTNSMGMDSEIGSS